MNQYSVLVNELHAWFNEIREWMAVHYLQLNAGKTEIIVLGTPKILTEISIHGSYVSYEACIRFPPVVKKSWI